MQVYSLETMRKTSLSRSTTVVRSWARWTCWEQRVQNSVGFYNPVWWRPNIVVIDKTKKEVKIVDVTIPGDVCVNEREVGKIEKYKVLKDEIKRMWVMKKVIVIPVAVGALGAISTGFEK